MYGMLNEAVNLDLACIFVAVPKTGTTSVRRQVAPSGEALIPNPHLDIVQIRDALYIYFLKTELGKNQSFPSEGILSDSEIRQQASDAFERMFKFSAVRNPWARTVSLYLRREGVQVEGAMSFDKFCEKHVYASDTCIHPTLHRNQIDWLCDESGECILDYVYRVEEFEVATRQIAARTQGRIDIRSERLNANPRSKARNYREMYTDRTRRMIERRFEKDIDYFKYVF